MSGLSSPASTVTFVANGGVGSMGAQTENGPATLTANSFTRAGYTFSGWNTAADGSGTAYVDGATYPFTSDATLYAQWAANSHTVTFAANGGAGSMAAETASGPTALSANSFTRAGYTFSGWNTAADGSGTAYADGATYPFTSDATLYAQWTAGTKASQTITFAKPANKTLAQSPLTVTGTASSGLAVSFTTTTPAVCSSGGTNGATITLLAAGTCTVTASQAGNATYNAAPRTVVQPGGSAGVKLVVEHHGAASGVVRDVRAHRLTLGGGARCTQRGRIVEVGLEHAEIR